MDATNIIFFITKYQVPQDPFKDITYSQIVCNYCDQKAEKHRTRLTVGGNRINYPDNCVTPTSDLLTVKLLLNSIISNPDAKFMMLDIKHFHLKTPMKRYKYLRLEISTLPDKVIEEYQLKDKVDSNSYIYVEVRHELYGLSHTGLIAQELLGKQLYKHGYHQSKVTPGFWKHKWCPVAFLLVVNDFGAKHIGKEHANYLIAALKKITSSTKIGMAQSIAAFCSTEIMRTERFIFQIFPCRAMSKKGYADSTTSKAKWTKINHINMPFQIMALRFNMLRRRIRRSY